MTLSRAELAAMPRTTPTALAEAAYASARATREARAPAARAVFRPTIDGKLLRQIGDAAVDMLEQRELPVDEVEMISTLLRSDLLQRYPQDEMAVLENWDCAWARDAAFVRLAAAEQWRVKLPEALIVP